MDSTHKQQILKLLNLDLMISNYLNEPKLHRKAPANNYKPKLYRQMNKNKGNLTASTLQVKTDNKWRNNSMHCMPNRTISRVVENKGKQEELVRSYSNRFSKRDNYTTENHKKSKHPVQSKTCIGSKIFKTVNMFDLEMPSQLAQSALKNSAKLRKANESTTLPDSFVQLNDDKNDGQSKVTMNQRAISKSKIQREQKIGNVLKGRYQLQKVIGRGLSGVVYKSKDILADRYVAIKVIDISNVEYQFIKEVQHPNIISYLNSFVQNCKRYLVLEYLPFSLSEIVRKRRLNEQQVKRVCKSVACGLQYLHSLSYAHRDIKLDNLVTNENLTVAKFIDFGLCLDTNESNIKQNRKFCGTTSYMAPEVISGTCKDPKKADIWSLGIVFYTLCVGRNPFTGTQQSEIFNKIKNKKIIFPSDLPDAAKSLLSSMLSKDADDRPTIIEVVNHSWLSA